MSLKQRLNEIPPNGEWWTKHAKDVFFERGASMIEQGFTEDETVELLNDLYAAVAGEFGS